MRTAGSDGLKAAALAYTCERCAMPYSNYKHLVQHLYWRHGTESYWCNKCCLKRWPYAPHLCHVLPFDHDDLLLEFDDTEYIPQRETDFCTCGKYVADAPMIGCDGPECILQWYHFGCVGIVEPPDGDWLCPACTKLQLTQVVLQIYANRFILIAACFDRC